MTDDIVKVPFGTLSHIDLDSIGHVPDAGLEEFFRDLGKSATVSQLRIFLDDAIEGDIDESDSEKAELVARFVERRVETVRALREAKASLNALLRK